jgi:hypothetical protein
MPKTILLLAGDILAIGIVTLIGFATHGETNTAALPRMLTTFLPLTASWLVIAPLLGLFNLESTTNPRQLWRPLVGMLFAGPLAALVRAMVLNTVVIPIFGLVLSGSAGFGMFIWRVLWYFLQRSRKI